MIEVKSNHCLLAIESSLLYKLSMYFNDNAVLGAGESILSMTNNMELFPKFSR